MTELMVQKGMTEVQKMEFQQAYGRERKDATVAILLALFLGGLGAHQFYLGNTGLGVLYALFVWTFIPSLIALVELFTLKGRVERRNDEAAKRVARAVKAYAG
jgi:TM2 domain-containing membrane protein YozV